MNSVELAIFSGRLNAICEEMGFALQRSAMSPNIKDRLDFSCALFDAQGYIFAQAAHIPVHLGSMAYAMKDLVSAFSWDEGDALVLNDPFKGGTHLPDVTVVAPIFVDGKLRGFVANRAHHANIGADAAGSMPLSSSAAEEGVLISPQKLMERGEFNHDLVRRLASIESSENGELASLPADFLAQLSANRVGLQRLQAYIQEIGPRTFDAGVEALNNYGYEVTKKALEKLPQGSARFTDYLDDDGFGARDIPLCVEVSIKKARLSLSFEGSSEQVAGNLNCPLSVTVASAFYVLMCLLPDYVPSCQGVFDCLEVSAPKGSVLNAKEGAAVAAGNVETSMRVVDLILGALSELGVEIPSASQGTMNNVALGSKQSEKKWDYYETLGGGMGAGPRYSGLSAVQAHMTNTLNTPVESLEMHYPLRILSYALRRGSGGSGEKYGGDGLIREYQFLTPTEVTLLTERRTHRPWGLHGAEAGKAGENYVNNEMVAGKYQGTLLVGDVLRVETPGGGGFGSA